MNLKENELQKPKTKYELVTPEEVAKEVCLSHCSKYNKQATVKLYISELKN